jgi:hypothetical protein
VKPAAHILLQGCVYNVVTFKLKIIVIVIIINTTTTTQPHTTPRHATTYSCRTMNANAAGRASQMMDERSHLQSGAWRWA